MLCGPERATDCQGISCRARVRITETQLHVHQRNRARTPPARSRWWHGEGLGAPVLRPHGSCPCSRQTELRERRLVQLTGGTDVFASLAAEHSPNLCRLWSIRIGPEDRRRGCLHRSDLHDLLCRGLSSAAFLMSTSGSSACSYINASGRCAWAAMPSSIESTLTP